MTRALIGVVVLALAGCCSSAACAPEALPGRGRVETPEDLFRLAQHAARNDCCEVLYGLLSPVTRAAHSETKFCLWWDSSSLALPEPWGYTVADIVRDGRYQGDIEYEGQRFLYVEYRELKPLQLLWVLEPVAGGRSEPRLALKEQFDPDPPGRPVRWNAGKDPGE